MWHPICDSMTIDYTDNESEEENKTTTTTVGQKGIAVSIKSNIKEADNINRIVISPVPVIAIVYMILFSIGFGIFSTLLWLELFTNVIIYDWRILSLSQLSCLGMVLVALVSIKDWREFLRKEYK